jgi:hypothetical protein
MAPAKKHLSGETGGRKHRCEAKLGEGRTNPDSFAAIMDNEVIESQRSWSWQRAIL